MAPETVEAVEFEMERKMGHPEKAFQAVRPHLPDIHEKHMLPDESQDGLRLLPGEAEPREDRSGNLLPPPRMAVKMDARGILEASLGLPDIVQQGRPGEAHIGAVGQKGEHPERMLPDVPLGVEGRRLIDTAQGRHLGQEFREESAFGEKLHTPPRPAARQHPGKLLPDPLGAYPPDGGRLLPDRRECLRVDCIIERGRKADSPEHPQAVFGKALVRVRRSCG